MSSHFFFSQTLKTAQAKKLCGAIMEQPTWRNVMGGSTGVVVNEKSIEFKDVPVENLGDIKFPDIASFEFYGSCQITSDDNGFPRRGMGKCDSLPEGLGSRSSCADVFSGTLQGVRLSSECDNSVWHQALLSSKYPELECRSDVHEINITIQLEERLPSGSSLLADNTTLCSKELSKLSSLIDLLKLPTVPYDAYLNCIGEGKNCDEDAFPNGTIHCAFRYKPGQDNCKKIPASLKYTIIYDGSKQPQWRDSILLIQEWLLKDKSSYKMSAGVDLGRMNWYSGYPQCVTLEARELLRRECDFPQYDSYNLSYMELGPESWEVREKRRKTVTEPRFMQLGECELDNGCKLTLRLKMLREGYVVYLDFPTEEDMIRFADTELYRLTKWQSSAE